jgi:hypothetical protein
MYMISKIAKKTAFAWNDTGSSLLNVLNKVQYGVNVVLTKNRQDWLKAEPDAPVYAGTEENPITGLPSKINNIMDAYEELERLVADPMSQMYNNLFYAKNTKMGELHIYTDKPMNYIPA